MPQRLPSFILAYHGCDKAIAESILSGNTMLKPSTNKYDWLGHGIYFWENNPKRALDWANEIKGKTSSNIQDPCAIGAIIDPGYCLDLTQKGSIQLLKETYATLSPILDEKMPKNHAKKGESEFLLRDLDCLVINATNKLIEMQKKKSFDTVRGVFIEGGPIYETSGIHEKTHMQFCVRNEKCIKGYFRIPDYVFDETKIV